MKRFVSSRACMVALGLGLAPGWSLSVVAQSSTAKAQETNVKVQVTKSRKAKKSPSDRTVRVVMGWAYAAVPDKIKTKDGKEIKIDRSDPKKFMIPVDDARRIIRVAMRSTNAKLCGLQKLETQNFRKMMAKEKALGKWTENQIRFIQKLHIATGLVMTGGFSVGKKAEEKDDAQNGAVKKYNCPPEKTARVTAAIEAYLREPNKAQ